MILASLCERPDFEIGGTEIAGLVVDDLVPQQVAAGLDAVAADAHAGAGDEPAGLILSSAAEAAADLLVIVSRHGLIPSFYQ